MTEESHEVPASAPPDAPVARWELFAVLGVLFVAELLRWPTLTLPWLRDQAAIHAIVDDVVQGRLTTPFPMPYTTAAFHTALGGVFAVFGESMLVPRVVATVLAAVSTALTWWLARRWFGVVAALAAVAATAFNPLLLSTPSVGLPNEPLPIVLTLFLLYEGLRRDKTLLVAAAGAVFAGTLYVRFFMAPMGVVFVALILLVARQRLRSALVFAGTAGVLLMPLAGVLFGTEAGREVLDFVTRTITGETRMHTTMGRSAARPLGVRAAETAVTLREILFGQMEVAGRTQLATINPLGPPLTALAVLLAGFRALRPRPGRALEDRLLFGWIGGALVLLTTIVAWPSELLDPVLGDHRAPRYFVLLLPAPFLAVGAFVAAVAERVPEGKVRIGAAGVFVAVVAVTAALPGAWRASSSLARDRLAEGWTLLEQVVGDDSPRILLDVPVGTASHWRTPRFLHGWADGPLLRPEERPPFADDPRLGLALEHPQMLYQLAPQRLRLDLAIGGRSLPAELHLFDPLLPPLAGLESGSVTTGPASRHLLFVSSSASLPQLAMQAPGERANVADRVAQLRALNPHLRALGTRQGPGGFTGAAYAVFAVDLAPRVWRELDLRFGAAADAAEDPEGVWLLPSTSFRPELGYGWDHGFVLRSPARGVPGLRPEFPGTVRVDVDGSRVEGAITVGGACGMATPAVELNGEAVGIETLGCGGAWGTRQLVFCRDTPEGRLDVRIPGDPGEDGAYAVHRLQLRVVESCFSE